MPRRGSKLVPLEAARARRTPIEWRAEDLPAPAFTGVRVLDEFPLATLREFIDWTPFFHTWELKGVYPRILDDPKQGEQARQIFAEANALLDRIIAEKLLTARGVYGFFPANAVGDDVELYADGARTRCWSGSIFCASRRTGKASEPCRSLADFIAPKETGLPDHIGAFAVTSGIGLKELCDPFRAKHDDYNAIMAEAIADRLAEAFAECLHKRVREEWGYGRGENLTQRRTDPREVSRHPARAGLSRMPRSHGEGHALAVARRAGEHRDADYRVVCHVAGVERKRALLRAPAIALLQPGQDRSRPGGRLRRRKGMSVAEVERWLGPNLNYDPAG